MDNRDRALGMGRSITRRDFLNGSAISIGSLMGHSHLLGLPNGIQQDDPPYCPPALTGMRGSHEGSFETMHALRDGKSLSQFGQPVETNETYDLIIVGAGISGLSAAFFFRAHAGPGTRILILDNHDDFGGHAKRNEFRTSGRLLLANGGTYAIESPTPYSRQARRLMDQLGVRPVALEKKCARTPYERLVAGFFFDKETFGTDKLVVGLPEKDSEEKSMPHAGTWKRFLSRAPLSVSTKQDIARLEEDLIDYLPGLTQTEKKRRLAKVSYGAFLSQHANAGKETIAFYQTRTHDLYGVGIDAVNALDCWAYGFPGFGGMKLERVLSPGLGFTARGEITKREPYFFHYPDGNASIARLLVRALIPDSITGHTAEDIVMAKADYHALDRPSSHVRIRLNSTAVRVQHIGPVGPKSDVDVEYIRNNVLYRTRAKSVVMACWNMVIPYLCPELPSEQKAALAYGAKVPLVY